MTDDFFGDLERQLVAATPDRARRVRRARARTAATLSTILIALLAGGAGIAAAVSGGDGDGAPSGTPATTAPIAQTQAQTGLGPTPGTFVVSVLNGTAVPGLARGVANRLQNDHYKIGNVTNAADQARAETKVYYATPDGVPAAREVAEAIGVLDARISKAGRAQRAIAGNGAQVIVVVGADQNQSPVKRR